jgi:hypothetical protein
VAQGLPWLAILQRRRNRKSLSLKSVGLKPAAIQVSGDVAVLCYWMTYQWIDKSGKSETRTIRTTHP